MNEPVVVPYTNEPTTQPDLAGGHGRAWQMNPQPPTLLPHATVAAWLLECPDSHPWWSWYVATAVHLRDLDGVRKAEIRLPGATHELIVVAVVPGPIPGLDEAFGDNGSQYLSPPDQTHQFEVPNDESAVALLRACVQACLVGLLVPDQDYRRAWEDSVRLTAEHLRTGGHS